MSYCVNCGVELDPSATACPLCNTRVYHPEQPVRTDLVTPYPTAKGTVETAGAKEFTILMSIILLTTSLVCVLLNLFSIPFGHWSFYVVGICAMLWVFLVPLFFPGKTAIYVNLLLDSCSILLFLGMVSCLHPNHQWFLRIALPIVLLTTMLLEILCFFIFYLKCSMIMKAIVSVTSAAILCIAVELLIDLFFNQSIFLRWSAIVLTCCVVIDAILFTIYLREGLRSEVRKRMHF